MHALGGAYLVHAVQGPIAHIASMEDGHGTALQGADTGKGGRPAFVHMASSTCTCSATNKYLLVTRLYQWMKTLLSRGHVASNLTPTHNMLA